jgi:hypothetical protein
MTKPDTKDLIDLGAASVETKGMQTQFSADELNQHKLSLGLAND